MTATATLVLRRERPRAETVAYAIGGLLVLSGVFHFAVFLADGGPWEGPVSWRKPTTFGLSFGTTLVTIAWTTSYLVMAPRVRAWLLGVLAADCVLEVAGISVQAWRHVPSHFNTATPFDRAVAMSLAFGGAVLVGTLVSFAFVAVRGRIRGAPDLRLALRAGFALLLGTLASGVLMIVKGTALVREGHPQLAYETAGFLKPVHFVTVHAVLVLPLIAETTRLLGWTAGRRHRVVVLASVLYLAATAGAVWLSLR